MKKEEEQSIKGICTRPFRMKDERNIEIGIGNDAKLHCYCNASGLCEFERGVIKTSLEAALPPDKGD